MSEKETKILDTFGKAIPKLSELEKEKLLAFGEGMAFMVERKDSTAQAPDTATVNRFLHLESLDLFIGLVHQS